MANTRLIKLHTDYKVDGQNKKWAYEIEVGEEGMKKEGMVYITHHLSHDGFSYFRNKEGFSLLIVLHNERGEPLARQFIPIQSLKQKNGDMLYTSGSSSGPGNFPFPYPDGRNAPAMYLQVAYYPDPKRPGAGETVFQIWPLDAADGKEDIRPAKEIKAAIGEKIDFSGYRVSVEEVRYWSSMSVKYDPGQPIVLACLW